MGAIGNIEVLDILKKYSQDPVTEVAETCLLAIARIEWLQKQEETGETLPGNPYASVDPTPPSCETDIEKLKLILLDDRKSLFDRYRAMFSLRNLNTPESVVALSEGK